ncbi:MAG: serine/threonine protein kinase, partial [Anaerolineae bacterium]|nr:serine/threonine protein kinase [Anaerolineae bacterium]
MSAHDLVGRTLGQYVLRELLGVGGMGAVYRGYQASLQRDVAVKVMIPGPEYRHDYEARFIREARTAAALEHLHIVPVHDYGIQDGISYVVMRLLTGGDLAERLEHSQRTDQPLPSLHEVARIVAELASALDYAHRQGVIHRDIKARNVMFDHQGNVFLVDFGIAKLAGATSGLTQPGAAVGTPWYMSPEQWQGREITPAADQYALAIVIYTMLTGKMPFEADTPWELMNKHVHEAPIPLSHWRHDLPTEIMPVLAKGMEKAPEKRYETVTALSIAFNSALQSTPITQPSGFFEAPIPRQATSMVITTTERQPKPKPSGRWRRIGIAWAVVMAAAAVIALLLLTLGSPLANTGTPTWTSTPTMTPTIPPVNDRLVPTELATWTPSQAVVEPSATPSAIAQATKLEGAAPRLPVSETPSVTATPTTSPSTPTDTLTPSPTWTATPSRTPTATPVPPTNTPTPIPPTRTRVPTETPTSSRTWTVTPSRTPTATRVPPTDTPTPIPPT